MVGNKTSTWTFVIKDYQVVTLPAPDGQPTANLQAPIVIGSESRRGRQVILFRDDLPLRHPVQLPAVVSGPASPESPARTAQDR